MEGEAASPSFLEISKEAIAVSLVSNEIKSSINNLLLAASPRSATTPGGTPVATPVYTRTQSTGVLSPWNGCVSHSMEGFSPLAGTTTYNIAVTPPGVSPELGPGHPVVGVVAPQPTGTALKIPRHSGLSPTRNRFHSPTSSSRTDESCVACDLRSIPDLEDDLGRRETATSQHSAQESRVEVEQGATGLSMRSYFTTASCPSFERAPSSNSLFLHSFTNNKPPRPPRLGRRTSGKFEPGWRPPSATLGMLARSRFHQGMADMAENMSTSLLSVLLLLLFMVLLVYGNQSD